MSERSNSSAPCSWLPGGLATGLLAGFAAGVAVGVVAATTRQRQVKNNKSTAPALTSKDAPVQTVRGDSAAKGLYLGVDIGGTTVSLALVQGDGDVIDILKENISTDQRSVEHVVSLVDTMVRSILPPATL